MSKDIKALLAQKLAENNARHTNAHQSTPLNIGSELKRLALDTIRPNPYQPRTVFDDAEIDNLAQSINEIGLLQPISVRATDIGDYEIIAGERRYKAHQQLGKSHIDAIVIQADDSELAILALAENASRQDLCDYEIGKALRAIEDLFPSKTKLAESIGINREDMYRYFSYDALPNVLLEKLATQPKLISRTAATQIKQAINELKLPESRLNELLLSAWDKLQSGTLEQTKMADYLRTQAAGIQLRTPSIVSKPILYQGKTIGKLQYKGKKLLIELNHMAVSPEQEQQIENFLVSLFAKPH